MNLATFSLILTGVLLNACAQLLLKAGANAIGAMEFTRANIVPIGIKLATQVPIMGGLVCYAISVVVWILALSRVEVSIAYPILESANELRESRLRDTKAAAEQREMPAVLIPAPHSGG